MAIKNDTQFVIKNGVAIQPDIPHDGLELYYDVKGKKNTDNYKSTLLDMSGNGRHGVLSNFAYEGVSGFTGTTEGGLLLDDVDDKIVRPAISGIEYTSASRNFLKVANGTLTANGVTVTVSDGVVNLNGTSTAITRINLLDVLSSKGSASEIVNLGYKINIQYGETISLSTNITSGTCSDISQVRTTALKSDGTSLIQPIIGTSLNTTMIEDSAHGLYIQINSIGITFTNLIFNIQMEKGTVTTAYTPYIPLPIMTYQMNGNVLSFEKDGTVKRTTRDVNGNRIVVSRKGINLVRNGNFSNEVAEWTASSCSIKNVDGSMTVTGNGTGSIAYISDNKNYRTTGHVYYAKAIMRVLNSNCTAIRLVISGVGVTTINSPQNGEWYEIDATCVGTSSSGNIVSAQHMYATSEIANSKVMEIQKIQAIDLTEAYGAGNEPTLAYIQAHPEEFAWTPNPNDLIETVEIKNNLVGDLENLQGSDFEQHEDGVVTYTTEGEEGSVVRVEIDGISDQPLRFRTATGEQVVITEHDQVDADAIKKVEFAGNSVQLADKYREVSGTSVTIDPTLHDKTVADKLVIGGNTTQYTESSNVVTDGLEMWLSGRNFSNSPATTTWKDLTGVNNGTASGFEYRTNVYADVVSDFAGKIAGSVVENANKFYGGNINEDTVLIPPNSTSWVDLSLSQPDIDAIKIIDGSSRAITRSGNGEIAQFLFSFDVIKMFEKQHGAIPSSDQTVAGKVAWLKLNLATIKCNWYGYGSCPTGNKASLDIFTVGSYSNSPTTNNSASPSLVTRTSNILDNSTLIQSNGFVHYIAYSDASDGVTMSKIYTDYVSLTLTTSGASGSDGAGGVNFDGVDDGVTIQHSNQYVLANRVTLDFIVSMNSKATSIHQILFCASDVSPTYVSFYNYQPFLSLQIDGVQKTLDSGIAIAKNQICHITATYDGSVMKIFVNGVFKNSRVISGTLNFGTSTKEIGKWTSNTNSLNGTIYSARIYNRALSDAEILQNYNAGVAIPIPNIAMPQEVKHVSSGSKVLVHGKNQFNRNTAVEGYAITWAGGLDFATVDSLRSDFIKVVIGKTYKINYKAQVMLFNENYTYMGSYNGEAVDRTEFSVLGANSCVYVKLGFRSVSNSNINMLTANIQLEEGSTATAYEPFKGYQETTIPVTLKSIG